MEGNISTLAKRPRCGPQPSDKKRYHIFLGEDLPEWFNRPFMMYSEQDIGMGKRAHWKFGWGYEKHPYWKVLHHETLGVMVVQWMDVQCRDFPACRARNCPFNHTNELSGRTVVGEYYRRIDEHR